MERGICVMAIEYHSMVMARHGMAQGISVDSIDESVSTRERPVLFFPPLLSWPLAVSFLFCFSISSFLSAIYTQPIIPSRRQAFSTQTLVHFFLFFPFDLNSSEQKGSD